MAAHGALTEALVPVVPAVPVVVPVVAVPPTWLLPAPTWLLPAPTCEPDVAVGLHGIPAPGVPTAGGVVVVMLGCVLIPGAP